MASKFSKMQAQNAGNIGESIGADFDDAAAPGPAAPPRSSGRLAGVGRTKDAAKIAIERIVADPDQPRKEFDEEGIAELAASLLEEGQIQPVRVRYDASRDAYLIISGERRYRAAIKAGLMVLDCIIDDRELTEEQLLAMQYIENCVRRDLKVGEQAQSMRRMIEKFGYTQETLAKRLKVSQATVSKALAVLNLAPDVREKVEAGTISTDAGAAMSKLAPEEQREVAAKVESGNLSREETVAEVKAIKERKPSRPRAGKGRGAAPAAKKLPKVRAFNTDKKIKARFESGRGFDLPTLADAIREVLGKVEAELATAGA